MILPKEKIKAENISPGSIVIYSLPKIGKTTALSELDDCLIVDFENGATFVDALKVRVNSMDDLVKLTQALKAEKVKTGKNPYSKIALDTVSKLEEMILPVALRDYKATVQGKNFKGTDVTSLPNGAGYKFVRDAFTRIVDVFHELCDHLILVGHVKSSMIEKEGREVNVKDLDLTGKLKNIVCASADVVGYLFRKKDGLYISFKAGNDITCGSRCQHLRGEVFMLGELLEDGSHKYFWDKIFVGETK